MGIEFTVTPPTLKKLRGGGILLLQLVFKHGQLIRDNDFITRLTFKEGAQ